jgi:hypothetical protein
LNLVQLFVQNPVIVDTPECIVFVEVNDHSVRVFGDIEELFFFGNLFIPGTCRNVSVSKVLVLTSGKLTLTQTKVFRFNCRGNPQDHFHPPTTKSLSINFIIIYNF